MTVKHLFPAVEPSLNLDFANSKKLDPRITFTRSSTGTYVDSNGVIKTAAANEARFDHDGATGSSLGLLVEEARTNLVLESEDWGNTTYWWSNGNKGGLNTPGSLDYFIATNNTTDVLSPDGANNAVKLTGDTSYTGGGYQQGKVNIVPKSITLSQNTVYTFSLFVKDPNSVLDSNQKLWIIFGSIYSNTNGRAAFDLQNNVVTFAADYSNGSGSIESYPNGWKKLTATFANTSSGGTPYIYIQEADNQSGPNTFSTNGESFYAFGFQIEQASFPTSYIPTSGSTVTRSADVASITGTNFSSWFNTSSSTIFTEYKTNRSGWYVPLWSLNDNGAYTGLWLQGYHNNQWNPYLTGLGNGSFSTTGGGPFSGHNKIAVSLETGSFQMVENGTINTSVASSNITGPFTAVTRLRFAVSNATTNTLGSMTFARLTYYPYRLTDAQLQALTL